MTFNTLRFIKPQPLYCPFLQNSRDNAESGETPAKPWRNPSESDFFFKYSFWSLTKPPRNPSESDFFLLFHMCVIANFDYKIDDIVFSKYYQVFRFGGIDKRHVSMLLIELPLLIKSMTGR